MSTSTTTNYGWTIPNDDELVKNGAAAIRTLGQAIDTTAASSFGGGLVHIETQDFTTVASVTFSNNVFTSDYLNYKIILNVTATTADADLYYRNTLSGTPATTSYYFGRFYIDTFSSGTSGLAVENNGPKIGFSRSAAGNYQIGSELTIYRPQIASETVVTAHSTTETGATAIGHWSVGNHTTATAYDSCTLGVLSGTFSGKAVLFGVKK